TYSAFRREKPIEQSSSSDAAASRSRGGKAQTRPTRSPKRSTSRLRIATAAKSETCWAVIAPTSISNGSGARVGRKPAKRTTRAAALQVRGQAGAGGVGALGRVTVLRVLVPRVRVAPVVEVARERREAERMERVAHHGELVRLVHADRLLGEPGLRPVRQPRR